MKGNCGKCGTYLLCKHGVCEFCDNCTNCMEEEKIKHSSNQALRRIVEKYGEAGEVEKFDARRLKEENDKKARREKFNLLLKRYGY